MIFVIESKTHGTHPAALDEEDAHLWSLHKWHLFTTKRHYGYYVVGYVKGSNNESVRLHRLVTGAKPGEIVDHINGNPLDNRRCNLRVTTSLVNTANGRPRPRLMAKGLD